MNRLILLFTASFFCISPLFSQPKTAELGILLGRSYYLGEINPRTHWGKGVGSFAYGGLFRYNLNDRYSLKLGLSRTELSAEDVEQEYLFNRARKAEFNTKLTDLAATIEFNFLPYKLGDREKPFSPYLFTGFAYYWYNPATSIDGRDVVTEEAENGRGLAFVFGPGLKLNLSRKIGLNFEWGFRKTFIDELDGLPNFTNEIIEQGKEYNNDWYVISGFILTFKITDEGPCPSMLNF